MKAKGVGYARHRNPPKRGDRSAYPTSQDGTGALAPLILEDGGRPLSSYDVQLSRETGKPTAVGGARLFGTPYAMPQSRLFAFDEAGWLKAMKLEGYAPRRPAGLMALQEVLFPYLDAL